MSLESHDGMIRTGEKRNTRRKTCPSATFFTTNRTWTDSGAKPGLHVQMSAINILSHGTAECLPLLLWLQLLARLPVLSVEYPARIHQPAAQTRGKFSVMALSLSQTHNAR
jgi:hypothetical protein